jgi:hypothetical protein
MYLLWRKYGAISTAIWVPSGFPLRIEDLGSLVRSERTSHTGITGSIAQEDLYEETPNVISKKRTLSPRMSALDTQRKIYQCTHVAECCLAKPIFRSQSCLRSGGTMVENSELGDAKASTK